jgi:hypothetical protein
MLSEDVAKKCGIASFALFLTLIIGTVFLTLVALTAGGGGHPPGGVILLIFAAIGIFFLSPIGLLLGLLGALQTNGKSLVGLVGNLLLFLLVLWFKRHI